MSHARRANFTTRKRKSANGAVKIALNAAMKRLANSVMRLLTSTQKESVLLVCRVHSTTTTPAHANPVSTTAITAPTATHASTVNPPSNSPNKTLAPDVPPPPI